MFDHYLDNYKLHFSIESDFEYLKSCIHNHNNHDHNNLQNISELNVLFLLGINTTFKKKIIDDIIYLLGTETCQVINSIQFGHNLVNRQIYMFSRNINYGIRYKNLIIADIIDMQPINDIKNFKCKIIKITS